MNKRCWPFGSALARPFQTFDGNLLYITPFEKAAAIGESLIINHPFIDGNKRTGMLGMHTVLFEYDIMVNAKASDLYAFIIKISTGEIRFDEIVIWLKANTSSI